MIDFKSFNKLVEYTLIWKEETGLNEDIMVDDGGSYKSWGHEPVLLVRNSTDPLDKEYVPILISDDPKVLDYGIEVRISDSDMSKAFRFVEENRELLMKLADEEIDHMEFLTNMVKLK